MSRDHLAAALRADFLRQYDLKKLAPKITAWLASASLAELELEYTERNLG